MLCCLQSRKQKFAPTRVYTQDPLHYLNSAIQMLVFDISSIFLIQQCICEVGQILYYSTKGVLSVCYKKKTNNFTISWIFEVKIEQQIVMIGHTVLQIKVACNDVVPSHFCLADKPAFLMGWCVPPQAVVTTVLPQTVRVLLHSYVVRTLGISFVCRKWPFVLLQFFFFFLQQYFLKFGCFIDKKCCLNMFKQQHFK